MKIKRKKIVIPTYPVGEPEPLPLFFEKRPYQGASGKVYPIPYVPTLSDEKKDVAYDGYVLENEYIRVELLPELGGKIHSALDKTNGYDFVYHNRVIKPAMVGLAGPWVSGGIEFNWPQHHRPTTFMPVHSCCARSEGRRAVFMGEVDYFHRMKGMLALSLEDGCSCIRADVTVYNATPVAHPFMWWANMAVQVNDDYKIVFPPDVEYVNDHERRAVLSWPVAKGVYRTARPYDYGEGTDIHVFSAVKVPSSFMVSRGQSEGEIRCKNESNHRIQMRQCLIFLLHCDRVTPRQCLNKSCSFLRKRSVGYVSGDIHYLANQTGAGESFAQFPRGNCTDKLAIIHGLEDRQKDAFSAAADTLNEEKHLSLNIIGEDISEHLVHPLDELGVTARSVIQKTIESGR